MDLWVLVLVGVAFLIARPKWNSLVLCGDTAQGHSRSPNGETEPASSKDAPAASRA